MYRRSSEQCWTVLRDYTGTTLGLHWDYTGTTPGLHWDYTGTTLGLDQNCTRTAPALMDLRAGLNPERVCVAGLFLWCLLLGALGIRAESGCKELPVFNPSPLVVKYGDPATATCSFCNGSCDYELRLEEPYQSSFKRGNQMVWNISSLTGWSQQILCYIFDSGCPVITLDVIVYQPPESVSVSFKNHSGSLLESPSGPLEEGLVYCLQCEVEAVAPVQNMTVAFYRGLRELNVMRSSITDKRAVNESFCLEYRVSRKDHGATFLCEARLQLGPAGPQPPPVVRSHNITANVHYVPETTTAASPVLMTTTAAPVIPVKTAPVKATTTAKPAPRVIPTDKNCAGEPSFLHHSLCTSIFVWVCWGVISQL